MEERNNFGKFIQTKRKEAGLTQHELADRLFITESAISKWERGGLRYNSDKLKKAL